MHLLRTSIAAAVLVAIARAATSVEFPQAVPCWNTRAAAHADSPCYCATGAASVRHVQRNFLSAEEVALVRRLAQVGMQPFPASLDGPTIMDPDLGLVLGPGAKQASIGERFSDADIAAYARVMAKTHDAVAAVHGIPRGKLFHTAPTFIARLSGGSGGGGGGHVHDEYWHLHADKNNTEHYDVSALVYLSTAGEEFEGGVFEFHDANDVVTALRPEAGMFLTFRSGPENAHRVTRVTQGVRLAFSTWWTCA
jgi:hypothetical protein